MREKTARDGLLRPQNPTITNFCAAKGRINARAELFPDHTEHSNRRPDMRPTNIRKSMLIVTTLACFAVNVPQARGYGLWATPQRRGLVLLRVSVCVTGARHDLAHDPNEGRAAFQGRSSLCPAGEYETATPISERPLQARAVRTDLRRRSGSRGCPSPRQRFGVQPGRGQPQSDKASAIQANLSAL